MPIDEALRERMRAHLKELDDIAEKPMVGGICFMLHGNLLCGVMGNDLLVRIAKKDYVRYITEPGARPMVMGGRSGRSWVLIDGAIVSRQTELAKWIDRAIEFVSTLPPK
jgi:TfoX/Sxy family transcriptional regulator of competence genes